MTIPLGEWELYCPAGQFGPLRRDREFVFLLTLARIVNAMKFGVAAHRSVKDVLSPRADRQRLQAFLYLAALTHEVLEFRDATKETWSGLTAYREVFAVFDDSAVDASTAEMLRVIRNRAAFHVQMDVAEKTLPHMPEEPFVFAAGIGRKRMNANYDLADLVTFGFLFGSLTDAPKAYAKFTELSANMKPLIAHFIQLADGVIISRLLARGFRIMSRPDGTYAAERTPREELEK